MRWYLIVMSILILGDSFAKDIKPYTREYLKAASKGQKTKITFKIIDDENSIVTNAVVQSSFGKKWNKWEYKNSDTNGYVVVSGKSGGELNYYVKKDGYYTTDGHYAFSGVDGYVIKDGKWQPWNPTLAVVLRKKINPIPMYAKKVETHIPATNTLFGYDLMKGDWAAPYGKGEQEDLLFNVTKKRVTTWSDFDGELSLTFSNKKDGTYKYKSKIGSDSKFSWDYNAPTNGYIDYLNIKVGYVHPAKGYYETNETAKCYFRIRTVTNRLGEITSAYYGKMPAKVEFDVRDTETAWLRFTYYLNPTPNDRNLEFNPKANLFKNLTSSEEVSAP